MNPTAGHRGEEIRNDCWVELTPNDPSIRIESPLRAVYGRQIEAAVRSALEEFAPSGCGANLVDSGAFDWCLRARIEAAAGKLGASQAATPKPIETRPSKGSPRRRRTRLYLPGNTPKFFVNAKLHGADAVILDLEDAVPPDEKLEARALVCQALRHVDFGDAERMVRINSGPEGVADLAAVTAAGADSILLPKTESVAQIEALCSVIPIIPLIESAKGVAHADEIAAATGVAALAIGVEDYLADIGGRRSPESLAYAYGQIVNAARARGLAPLGSVWADVDDETGFFEEVRRLISLGFEGVGCLHPSQIAVALRAFRPSDEEIEWAKRVLEAFDAHGGAVSVDGKMVDAPVAARARKVLDRAEDGRPSWRLA